MKIFTSNELYIQINEAFHTVEDLYYPGMKLTKGFGYIKGKYVYIYRGKLKDGEKPSKCGIYKIKGEYEFVEPRNDYEKRLYDVDNVEETDPDSASRRRWRPDNCPHPSSQTGSGSPSSPPAHRPSGKSHSSPSSHAPRLLPCSPARRALPLPSGSFRRNGSLPYPDSGQIRPRSGILSHSLPGGSFLCISGPYF